nr:PH domain-containing protein [Mycetocola zhujimingii]
MTHKTGPILAHRLPNSYLLAAYGQTIPRVAALLVSGFFLTSTPGVWPGGWAWLLIGPLLLAQVLAPVYARATFRLVVTTEGVSITSGLFAVHTRTLEWHSVGAVNTNAPWAFRLLNLSQVEINQAGDGSTRFLIPAVDEAARRSIESAWAAASRAPSGVKKPPSDAPSDGVIYRSSTSDLLIASVVYGQFAVAGGALAVSAADLLNTVGLPAVTEWAAATPPIWFALIAAALISAGGLIVTAVRLHGFVVTRQPGAISLRYGLINRQERSINTDAIAGILVKRNLIESAFGRVRLSLLTRDSSAGSGADLVLPSLPQAIVAQVLREAFVKDAPARHSVIPAHRAMLRSSIAIFVVFVPSAVLLAVLQHHMTPLYLSMLLSAGLSVVLYCLGWLCTATVASSRSDTAFTVTSPFISEREWRVEISSVHVLSAILVRGEPLLFRVHYYAGRPRSLWFTRLSRRDLQGLVDQIMARRAHAVPALKDMQAEAR